MLTTIRNFLMGKKTYVVAVAAMIAGILAWVEGTLDHVQMIEIIVAAIMGMTLRAGMNTAAK